MDIGSKIKELRQDKGLTQTQLAKAISKTTSSLQKYENGQTAITIDILEDIAKALNINIINFFIDDGDDILLTIKQRYNLKDNPRGQLEYDFNIFMKILKEKYK